MRRAWLSSLGVALGVWTVGGGAAEPIVWRAAAPAATIGQPVPIPEEPSGPVTRVTWSAAPPAPRVVVRAQAGDLPPPAPPPGASPGPPAGLPPGGGPPPYPPPGIPYNPPPSDGFNSGVVPDNAPGTGFWDKTKAIFDLQSGPFCGSAQRKPFQSDHGFDGFISPVSNPFFFEDPRALTELRPIFMYQSIPSKNAGYHGGNVEFFGVQGRVALTDWLSIDVTKLGGIWEHPGGGALPAYAGDRSGFADINLGPKWTFLRNTSTGTLGAAGLWFDIPTGSSRIQQANGLSLFPFLTMGQNFGRSSYGSFNALGEIGYSFAVDNKPSDYFMTSLHLDYDVGNLHKIYPLAELTWRYYAGNGKARVQNFEGGDLVNFGATEISGRNNVNLALGARYKFNETFQVGGAFEFPVVGTKDWESFRFTLDFIVRY